MEQRKMPIRNISDYVPSRHANFIINAACESVIDCACPFVAATSPPTSPLYNAQVHISMQIDLNCLTKYLKYTHHRFLPACAV